MIEYEALTKLYLYDTKIRKKDKDGEPALANMAIPVNVKYETTAVEYLATAANNYYRFLAHDEPADDAEEPADKKKYDEKKANNLAEAAKNENEKGRRAETGKQRNNERGGRGICADASHQ